MIGRYRGVVSPCNASGSCRMKLKRRTVEVSGEWRFTVHCVSVSVAWMNSFCVSLVCGGVVGGDCDFFFFFQVLLCCGRSLFSLKSIHLF